MDDSVECALTSVNNYPSGSWEKSDPFSILESYKNKMRFHCDIQLPIALCARCLDIKKSIRLRRELKFALAASKYVCSYV